MDNSENTKVLNEYEKYTQRGAVEGSVAYDLSRFDERRTVRDAVSNAPAERGEQPRREPKPRSKFSFSAFLMYFAIAGLAALLIYNYMTLTIMTDDLSTLSKELQDLKNEEIILQKQYDQRYTLSDIEKYAVDILGMEKLESNMMEYIELPNPDTITKLDPYEDSRVTGFFKNLGDRFKELLAFLA